MSVYMGMMWDQFFILQNVKKEVQCKNKKKSQKKPSFHMLNWIID